jgi:hypothetical protein
LKEESSCGAKGYWCPYDDCREVNHPARFWPVYNGVELMDIYRSPMEKILKQQENDTVITNPKEPFKTFLRKIAYLWARGWGRCKKIFKR